MADAAYGDGDTRRQFADADRTLIAKVPKPPRSPYFHQAGFSTSTWKPAAAPVRREKSRPASTARVTTARDTGGGSHDRPLSSRVRSVTAVPCDRSVWKAKPGRGRSVSLHPQEDLLQEARAFQASAAFAPYRARRQVAEHRLAHLVQLGLRQARYRGRLKTKAQLLLAATVANLTRLWAATKETPPALCPGT